MRVAFVGKGGSGKTTIAALASRFLASEGAPVMAVDADINQHLASALGMDEAARRNMPALGLGADALKEHLRGENPLIRSAAEMIKTTPPGRGSRLLRPFGGDPVLERFCRDVSGVRLICVGESGDDDTGIRCYHSKVGAAELLLNHLVDGPGEYVIVDMTAGADAFASGLFTRFDLTVAVVEPTLKSVGVFEQYRRRAEGYGVRIAVAANKVSDASDLAFIRERTGAEPVAVLGTSAYVRRLERGETPPVNELEPEHLEALAAIRREADARSKDWERYHRQTVEFHRKNAESWANAATGADLLSQIDPSFRYPGA